MNRSKRNKSEDTIAAVSTPPGEGGIGIVRVSGPDALRLVASVFRSSSGRSLDEKGRRVFHGTIGAGAECLDEVLVHVMRAPHSYTREDVVEINGHGGAGPLNAVLELVLEHGARLAHPGEFTKRAFLNGRIDLVQAEAVIDRIRAQTRASLLAASSAAGGVLSRTIHELTASLRDILARVEAAVDFPEEDLPDLVNWELKADLVAVFERMQQLLATAELGRLYREGTSVAIAGRPNVGKSSLFNALLREARAIVTEHAGTTRDLIQEIITINGIPVRLIDTAGLREAQEAVEKIGVEFARNAVRNASVVLFIIDASTGLTEQDRVLASELAALDLPTILVPNKIDLGEAGLGSFEQPVAATCPVSALHGTGLEALEKTLFSLLTGGVSIATDQGMITRTHQRDSLRRALAATDHLLGNIDASPEFLSIDIRDALKALGEITGETTPDEILDRIFASFCIGK
jgi:tRNA modification GTPase